jgi:hypothetical protein
MSQHALLPYVLTGAAGLIPQAEIWSDKLQNLCLGLRQALEAATLTIDGDSDAPSDGNSVISFDDSLDEIAEDLRIDTHCLAGLEPLLEHPILDSIEVQPQNNHIHAWNPASLYAIKIESRYPLAEKELVIRLANINYERYLRCQFIRDSHERNEEYEPGQVVPDLSGTLITNSKFHDSGLGTSIAQSISYAETIMSYYQDVEGRSIRIPPLPDTAKAGGPFDCVACGSTVRIKNDSTWK